MTEGTGDGEAGRDGNADGRHLRQPGALAAQDVLHGRGAFGAPAAERVDQRRLRVRIAHAGVATEWRDMPQSHEVSRGGVGYWPEKQAWQ